MQHQRQVPQLLQLVTRIVFELNKLELNNDLSKTHENRPTTFMVTSMILRTILVTKSTMCTTPDIKFMTYTALMVITR